MSTGLVIVCLWDYPPLCIAQGGRTFVRITVFCTLADWCRCLDLWFCSSFFTWWCSAWRCWFSFSFVWAFPFGSFFGSSWLCSVVFRSVSLRLRRFLGDFSLFGWWRLFYRGCTWKNISITIRPAGYIEFLVLSLFLFLKADDIRFL